MESVQFSVSFRRAQNILIVATSLPAVYTHVFKQQLDENVITYILSNILFFFRFVLY